MDPRTADYPVLNRLQVADAEEELLQEAVVDEDIIGPVLEKMAKDVAMDTLEDYNDKAMHQQLKEVYYIQKF